jgi:hypothetical protein
VDLENPNKASCRNREGNFDRKDLFCPLSSSAFILFGHDDLDMKSRRQRMKGEHIGENIPNPPKSGLKGIYDQLPSITHKQDIQVHTLANHNLKAVPHLA